jgi:hypothetical protein
MNGWHMAIATALCVLIVACSRRENVFAMSPVFTARSSVSASAVAGCVVHRWKQGTRSLHRAEGGGAITVRAVSFFSGTPIGLRVVRDGALTRVEYYRRRYADPLYGSMVRACLHPDADNGADSTPAIPQS